jgi:hypothetical protein
MFNLEQSIAEWRNQMLAAGIKSPVLLEELEGHLREQIEEQIRSGLSQQQAFEMAVQQIGQASSLKTEFVRACGWRVFMGENRVTRTNRIFGTIWLILFSWGSINMCRAVRFDSLLGEVSLAILATYIVVIFGSVQLIRGTRLGRNIIIFFAGVLSLVGVIAEFESFSIRLGVFTLFYLVTLWFLLLSRREMQNQAAK